MKQVNVFGPSDLGASTLPTGVKAGLSALVRRADGAGFTAQTKVFVAGFDHGHCMWLVHLPIRSGTPPSFDRLMAGIPSID